MFIAVVLQRAATTTTTKPPESVGYSCFGDTAEEAASTAEASADTLRKANTGCRYRTVVGEVTHEVTPPERQIVLKPIKQ
jgi:hypothetical protein